MAALPYQDRISQASTRKVAFKTLVAQFGNGYEQRSADGINSKRVEWNFIWENFNTAEFTTLTTMLDSIGGWGYLAYQGMKFKMGDEGYSITAKAGDIYDISVAMKQVFDA